MKKMPDQLARPTRKQPLPLDRETVRHLQCPDLRHAAGGDSYRCHSGYIC